MKTIIWNLETERKILAEVDDQLIFAGKGNFIDKEGTVWELLEGGAYNEIDKTMNYYTNKKLFKNEGCSCNNNVQ